MDQIATSVAFEIDRKPEINRWEKLHLADFACPSSDHLTRSQIATVNDPECIEQFRSKPLGAPAIIGQCCERLESWIFALVHSVVALKPPDCDQHFPWHIVAALDPLKY